MCRSVALAKASLTSFRTRSRGNFVIGWGSPLRKYWFLKLTCLVRGLGQGRGGEGRATDLVVEKRHDQACCRTAGTTLFPFVAADGVKGVDGALPLYVQAADDGVDVVWEEAFPVQQRLCQPGDGGQGHGTIVHVVVYL
jgi:hypothetical protein